VVKNIEDTMFPSIKETYEEIKNMYGYEQVRFQSIENKTASFLTLNSLLLMILVTISKLFEWIYFIPAIIFLIFSIIFSFKIFNLKKGKRPHQKYEDFYKYAKLTKKGLFDKFLLNYIDAIENEENINNGKIKYLDGIIVFSKFAWVAFIAGTLFYIINRALF